MKNKIYNESGVPFSTSTGSSFPSLLLPDANLSKCSLAAPQGLFFYLLAIELVLDAREKLYLLGFDCCNYWKAFLND